MKKKENFPQNRSFRFDAKNAEGRVEPWTGRFTSEKDADKWKEKYGPFWKSRGIKLIKRACVT